jgi:hypothetical protein
LIWGVRKSTPNTHLFMNSRISLRVLSKEAKEIFPEKRNVGRPWVQEFADDV